MYRNKPRKVSEQLYGTGKMHLFLQNQTFLCCQDATDQFSRDKFILGDLSGQPQWPSRD